MNIIRKIRSPFHDDWCKDCGKEMEITKKQLYMLPQTVGHYVSHENASYYKQNLIKVERKADIPVGCYACGIHAYYCPECCNQLVKLSIFLPVRDQEKYEDVIYFHHGEMDDFLNK